MRMILFLPLNKRNTCDKAKGVRITSEGHIGGGLGVRCLSTLNRGVGFCHNSLKRADARRSEEGREGLTSTFCTFV